MPVQAVKIPVKLSTGTGIQVFQDIDAAIENGVLVNTGSGSGAIAVRNDTASTIAAGALVYVNGWNNTESLPTIDLADADAGDRAAQFIVQTAILAGQNGLAFTSWQSTPTLNTNAGNVGDPVYLDTTAGGWTLTAPATAAAFPQIIGFITVKSATVGVIGFQIGDLAEPAPLKSVTAGAVPASAKVQIFDSTLNHRRTNAVVAAAGTNQGNAAALTADLNAITGADGTKGVVLPTAVAGDGILIINTDAANTLKVYPATGAAVNAIAANSPFIIGAGRAAIFEATSATQWYADQLAAATPTAAETNTLAGVVAGIVSASKALVVDAALALSGLLIKLGNATTVQSPPVAGIAPDLTVNNAGTTQSQFYTLNTVTIPANALSANGKGIQFTFMGILAANANNKDFRLGFGAATTTLATAQAGNGVSYYCTGVIYRTSAGNQILVAEITIGNAAPFPVCVALTQDETTALALTLQSQNTAAAASSATGKGAVVWFSN